MNTLSLVVHTSAKTESAAHAIARRIGSAWGRDLEMMRAVPRRTAGYKFELRVDLTAEAEGEALIESLTLLQILSARWDLGGPMRYSNAPTEYEAIASSSISIPGVSFVEARLVVPASS